MNKPYFVDAAQSLGETIKEYLDKTKYNYVIVEGENPILWAREKYPVIFGSIDEVGCELRNWPMPIKNISIITEEDYIKTYLGQEVWDAYYNDEQAVGRAVITDALHELRSAYDKAYDKIVEVVKANGGFIKTPAESGGRLTLNAYYEDFDGLVYTKSIHGLRWDEEKGLTICTDEMLDNYQYDNQYFFEYYFDFVEGDDAVHFKKAIEDPTYFVEFDKYGLHRDETIKSILAGLPSYLTD